MRLLFTNATATQLNAVLVASHPLHSAPTQPESLLLLLLLILHQIKEIESSSFPGILHREFNAPFFRYAPWHSLCLHVPVFPVGFFAVFPFSSRPKGRSRFVSSVALVAGEIGVSHLVFVGDAARIRLPFVGRASWAGGSLRTS